MWIVVYRIVAAQLNDSGKYVCIAHNSLSRVLVGAELIVQGTLRLGSYCSSHLISSQLVKRMI